MTHEELEEAVPLYATGALDRTERQALEAHLLSGCPSCHHALKEYQSLAALLPFGLIPAQAPRALKAKIMAARNPVAAATEEGLKDQPKPSLEPGEWMNHLFPPVTPARSLSLPWAVAFATVVLLGVAAYFGWHYASRLSDEASKLQELEAKLREQSAKLASLQRELGDRTKAMTELQGDVERRAGDIAQLKEQLIQRETDIEGLQQQLAARSIAPQKHRSVQDELAALLRQPSVRAVSMTGSEMAKTASAFLLYDAGTKKVWMYAVNLPECLNGTVYQLWAIDQKPRSIGTFHMDSGQTAHLLVTRVPDFERAKQFAVSLEPPGGRPQPTGAIYLVSQS
ncbi:MAG TPA: anti-sigma factor [Nitrospira sp.]|nr:anti-sigma factor [Nitrospira sp.]